MKKYLLFIISMLCVSIGAWANVTYPYSFGTGSSVDYDGTMMTVNIATTGDFQTFVDKLAWSGEGTFSLNKTNNLRINCTNNATISSSEVTNLKTAKSNNAFVYLDLTNAAFDADATITSLIANGVTYVALPQGKDISNITLKDDGTIKGVVTSNGSSAIYTAYNGAGDSNFSNVLTGSSLQSVGAWTITNGEANSEIKAGNEANAILETIIGNSTASTLSVTCDGLSQNATITLKPSSSITNLTLSGIKNFNDSWQQLIIDGSGTSDNNTLTALTIENSEIPNGATINDFAELTTADLRGMKLTQNKKVTLTDDPKLASLILYKSSSDTQHFFSGTTNNSGTTVNVTYALPAIPIEYHDCQVTINRDFATGTMTSLINEAKTHLGSTDICTLKVTGELSTTDLESLDDANKATRIDLSEATLATGASVDNIQVPTTLLSLVLPPNNTVSSTLETELAKATNFEYVYSETSNNGATVPTYVWIAKTGVMADVFLNESSLTSAVYLKVAAKSGVSLDQNSVDLSKTNMNSLQFLDVSESGLTTAAAPYYKAPHSNPYRIILPNNWSGDDMATFAANSNVGAIAAVYSYHGTTLKIMEIIDASYSQAALADPRIMRSGTTEVDVVSGYYNGNTYAQFGTNLLAALNNMGKSSFSVTTKDADNNDVVTNYNNTVGQSVKTISIETTSAAPNALTFDNPSITTLKAENLVQNDAELNVSACSALTNLSVKGSNLKSVTASNNTSITSADFSGTAIATTTNFNGATKLATFTTTSESIFNGNVDLTSSKLSAFTSEARFGGNINFNASSSLASIDLSGATIASTSVVHIDKDATEATENTSVIDALKVSATKTIKLPSSFPTDAETLATRIHPYAEAADYIEVASTVAPAYNITTTDMTFHDKVAGDNTDHYRYWYQGTADSQKILTLGTSDSRRLSDAIGEIPADQNYSTTQYAKIKVVGPLTSADITSLKDLNCTALDLSEATYGGNTEGETIGDLLKASFSNTSTLGVHSNVKFIALPGSCTRDYILNKDALEGLKNSVYCVIAVNETSEGKDLTSYSFQSGSLQPAVVAFQNSAANSWTKILTTEETPTTKYTSTVSNFKKLKISGLINSYDLSKGDQKLDADGHLSWKEDVKESTDQTRTLNGAYNVYGPFSACHLLTEIDLRDAYFEPKSGQTVEEGSVYFRYWYSDMTLSFLNVISTATYKVVIPQNSKVREIPADFMRCSTNIRAICIPSNIQAIRTRAFYTIDYVWTTADAYATGSTTADPEGNNTRLDNGAKLSNGTAVSALLYENGKYKENPEFQNSYYTADYSGVDGGGTYTFGSTLKLIETGAFANTQPNVSDVYVLNTTAPECHVDAFNTVMYTGNGGYNSAKVSSEGIITRDAYYNGRWITMLHYPRQTTDPQIQRYTDPTRSYSIATGLRDGKGAILYFPNQSEFIRAYQQGTYGYTWNAWNPTRTYGSVDNGKLTDCTAGWTATDQSTANALFDAYATGTDHQYRSFYKVSGFGTSDGVTAPTAALVPYYNVNWSGSAYSTGNPGNLYPQSEIDGNNDADNSGEKTTKDYRGWHQFVLNAYAANTVLDEEPYRSYITDNEWWTICPEFDITRYEAALLFGKVEGITTAGQTEYPRVHKLKYVRRTYSDGVIHLCFTKDLATYKENRTTATVTYTKDGDKITGVSAFADQHGRVNSTTGVIELLSDAPATDDVIMSAGVPYLIKPNLPLNAKRQYIIFKSGDDANNYNNNKSQDDPIGVGNESLYYKIKYSQDLSGTAQRAMIKSGTYTVPVFVLDYSGSKYTMENVEEDNGTKTIFKPNDEVTGATEYYRSVDRHYTFVGTFYKSFLPHYSYFLGWDSKNSCAKFYYHNGNFTTIDNEMRWANGTGVIVPTLATDLEGNPLAFKYSVTQASDMAHPAQWDLQTKFADDSFVKAGSSAPRVYVMDIDSPDMQAVNGAATAIMNVNTDENMNVNKDEVSVYTLDGRKVANSLQGLSQGIYIVNGKKYVVK